MNKQMFSNRSLVIIGISESVSNIGNWITMMAVYAMIVFKGNGTVIQSSGVFLAGLLPTLIFSPVAGWLCDRFDRKKLMIASELLSGVVIVGLIFTKRLEIIYAILALQAISMSVMTPARQSVVPDLVDREALTQANAFLQQLAGLIKIVAPILAGLILAVMDPHEAIILDVVSFFLSALILAKLPRLLPHPVVEKKIQEKTNVWNVLKASRPLQLLFWGMFLCIFIIIGFDVLSPIFIRDVLSGNEQFFGLMVGSIGCGTVLASILFMLLKRKGNPWRDLALGLFLASMIAISMVLALVVSSALLGKIVVMLGCLVGGFGNGLLLIQSSTILQTYTPPAILGRISGAFQSTAVAGQLSGLLLTPLLVPGILSMGVFFFIEAVAIILLAIFIGLSTVKMQQVGQSEAGMMKVEGG
jgi:MFS family permease